LAFLASWWLVIRKVTTSRNIVRLTVVAAIGIGLALSSPTVRQRLADRNARTTEIDGVARNSADVRWMVLRTAWQGFKTSPVVGLGFAQFQSYSVIDPEINRSTAGGGDGTHNTYVEVLVEGGILAFACLLMHLVQCFKRTRDVLSEIRRSKDTVLAGALVGFPIALVCAALANVLVTYHFWCACGLALASTRPGVRAVSDTEAAVLVRRTSASLPSAVTQVPKPAH